MRLDLAELVAAADAHDESLRGPLWAPNRPKAPVEDVTALGALVAGVRVETRPVARLTSAAVPRAFALPPIDVRYEPRQFEQRTRGRVPVCLRLKPEVHAQVRRLKAIHGITSDAGVFEYLLRLALAAAGIS